MVFVLPVAFTIIFGGMVLVGALDSLDRELKMWPESDLGTHSSDIIPYEMLDKKSGVAQAWYSGDGNSAFLFQ